MPAITTINSLDLNDIVQNFGHAERIGDRIRMVHLDVLIALKPEGLEPVGRFTIVVSREPTINSSTVFEASAFTNAATKLYDPLTREKFRVLFDRTLFPLGSVQGASQQALISIRIKVNSIASFNGPGALDHSANRLSLVFQGEVCTFDLSVRLWFEDADN
jgi:hypothetical protein